MDIFLFTILFGFVFLPVFGLATFALWSIAESLEELVKHLTKDDTE